MNAALDTVYKSLNLPKKLQDKYNVLVKKRHNETLTDVEYQELLNLTAQVESINNQRLLHLIELSKLRNESLDEVMSSLEIKPRLNIYFAKLHPPSS
jgi:predicted transcriptional regulator